MSVRIQFVVIAIVLAVSVASFGLSHFYSPALGFKVGIPALVVAGWAFFGHLVTLDDDAPGGFSNPGSSSRFWRSSLFELLLKLVLLVVVCVLVFSGQ